MSATSKVLSDTRIEVRPTAFRIPDLCVISEDQPAKGVIRLAPIFIIEILSPDDSMAQLRAKAQAYLKMGIRNVWSVDPISGECYEHFEHIMKPIEDAVLRVTGSPIVIPVAEILASL